jgi:hypothetical protein
MKVSVSKRTEKIVYFITEYGGIGSEPAFLFDKSYEPIQEGVV